MIGAGDGGLHADDDEHGADKRTEDGNEQRRLESAAWFAGAALEHDEGDVHGGEHDEQQQHGGLRELFHAAAEDEERDDAKQHKDRDVRAFAHRMHGAEHGGQQALAAHAVEQARAHEVIQQRSVPDGEDGNGSIHRLDAGEPRRGATGHFHERRVAFRQLLPRHDGHGGDGDGHVNARREDHCADEAERDVFGRIFHFLAHIEDVLETNERVKGEHRSLHDERKGDARANATRCGVAGRLKVVHAAPVAHADGDDEQQTRRLNDGAENVQPHALANAAIDDATDEEHDADGHELDAGGVQAPGEEFFDLPDDGLRAGGHAGESAHHHGDADDITEQRFAQTALRDVSRAACFRVASADAGIRQAGEHRTDHRHEEGKPDGVTKSGRRFADQRINPGSEHRTETVKHDLPAADGLDEGRLRGGFVRHGSPLAEIAPGGKVKKAARTPVMAMRTAMAFL